MILEAAGGAIIGIAASVLWLGVGRISGITGVIANLFLLQQGHRNWSLYFFIGLLVSFPIYSLYETPVIEITSNLVLLIVGGLLVGMGTYIGNGCTSGHGVCGTGRLSIRSIAATVTFMATGFITVFAMRQFGLL